ncbi:hypothetical protein R3W88_009668 [Solanum pinnatisectum]|uniref:UDP-glycosyltransferases domain-containing protein n=1 Tax=Solanum pinnatisectum TaxID=50273 RepID=A0AAV9MDL6_9SOLN|nr:hypothetical protein R3W88_009668 [Solanum pinnatisectum]
MSYFGPFITATKLMQPLFEQALSALQHPPTCVISDAFLGWTQESAEKIGIPRYFFSGMSVFAMTLCQLIGIERPHAETISPDENDFEPHFGDLEPKGLAVDFWIELAFGTQADISAEQIQEIAKGLELSNTCFLWVTRQNVLEHLQGLENRVKNRAFIVKEWVDQNQVLNHKSIKGFLSHCGWNSILECICAKVPILALPFMAVQHLNARMVTEEIGVGLRIMPRNGSVRGFVEAEAVEKMVRELTEGEKGEMVRKKVKDLGVNAEEAMNEGGSSWSTLGLLIDDACARKL